MMIFWLAWRPHAELHPFQSQWLLGGNISPSYLYSHFSLQMFVRYFYLFLPADSHCSARPLSIAAVVPEIVLNTGPGQEYHRPRLVVKVSVGIVREAGVVFLQGEAVSVVISGAGGCRWGNRGAVSSLQGAALATLQS